MNKLLFVRNRGLGDILMTTIAIRRLRIKYPSLKKLIYACDSDMIDILKYNPYIDEIINIKDSKIYNGHDSRIDLLWKVEDYRINNSINKKNRIDRFLELCKVTDINDNYHLDYFITDEEKIWAIEFLRSPNKPVIGICIQANAPYRTWNITSFSLLIDKLSKLDVTIILFDKSSFKDIIANDSIVNTCGKLSIRQLFALISQCNIVVSGDTGDSHVCAALDIPNIILYGSLPPESRCKYYPHAIPIYKPILKCIPCWDGQYIPDRNLFLSNCRNRKPPCLQNITVDEVYNKIIEYI